jgi:DNA-binding transcriptional regulator YhcF (GntR family)
MDLDFRSDKAIYLQIAEQIEDAIFTGAYEQEMQIPSTTEISVNYKINPATVLKGMNILVTKNIIYKRRGVGMFVAEGAYEKIMESRQDEFATNFVETLIDEAKKLNITKSALINIIERSFNS